MADQTILVVEDDARVSALLRNVLEEEGFAVREAASRAEVLNIIATVRIDLITLDIHLGADNGLEVARDTKPFHIREVVARVRSVLRRAGQAHPEQDMTAAQAEMSRLEVPGSRRFAFDGMTATPDRLELLDRAGSECALTTGDYRLLTIFLERPKRVLSRDQLMDLIGGQSWSPLDRTIDNQVARLRKKIERNPSRPKLIKTVRGVGYMLACDVEVLQSGALSAKSA